MSNTTIEAKLQQLLNPQSGNSSPHFASQALKKILNQTTEHKEEILFLVKSHLNLKGDYTSSWLCITDLSLLIINEHDGEFVLYHKTALTNLKSITNILDSNSLNLLRIAIFDNF